MAIVAVAAFDLNLNMNKSDKLSSLALANIEALAQNESSIKKECWKSVTTKENTQVFYCGTCSWVPGTYSWTSGTDTCSE